MKLLSKVAPHLLVIQIQIQAVHKSLKVNFLYIYIWIFSKNIFYPFSAYDVFTDVSIYSAYNTVYSRASRSENHFALPTRHFGLLFDNRQSQLFFRLEFRKNFAVNCFFRQEVDIIRILQEVLMEISKWLQNSLRIPVRKGANFVLLFDNRTLIYWSLYQVAGSIQNWHVWMPRSYIWSALPQSCCFSIGFHNPNCSIGKLWQILLVPKIFVSVQFFWDRKKFNCI